jgi:hypothetical protein
MSHRETHVASSIALKRLETELVHFYTGDESADLYEPGEKSLEEYMN